MQVLPTLPSPTRTVLTRTRLSSLGPALYPPRAIGGVESCEMLLVWELERRGGRVSE